MKAHLSQLFWMTVQNPAQAAGFLRQIHVDRVTGWMILILAIVLNTLAYFASISMFPPPQDIAIPLLETPFLVFTVLGSTMVTLVFAFFWVGRMFDGKATFDTILLMVGWLQYMRLAIQLVGMALMLIAPALSSLFVMAAGLYGIWVVINFLQVAHGFETPAKAIAVIVFSFVGLAVGLSVFLSLIAVTAFGIS